MTQPTMKQAFAFHKTTERMISIAEAQNGLHCECICTHCNSLLVAKQGQERSWHFAHHTGADCDGAAESALHRAAKQIIIDRSGMILPAFAVRAVEAASHGRRAEHVIEVKPVFTNLSCIRQEVPLMVLAGQDLENRGQLIRPDLVAANGNTDLLVEVAVTHFVDFDKHDLIEHLGLAAVEITVDPELQETWDWDSLAKVVIDGHANKEWIFYPAAEELRKQARSIPLHTTSTPLRNMLTLQEMLGGCDGLGSGRIQGDRPGRPASG
ncbi:MAG: competence protein CoiA family protein, partial [Candidatus Dechloromonas phosphoritropha]